MRHALHYSVKLFSITPFLRIICIAIVKINQLKVKRGLNIQVLKIVSYSHFKTPEETT